MKKAVIFVGFSLILWYCLKKGGKKDEKLDFVRQKLLKIEADPEFENISIFPEVNNIGNFDLFNDLMIHVHRI